MRNILSFIIICIMITPSVLSAQNNHTSTHKVASFNLRMDTSGDGENAWPNRKEMVKGLISFHNLDIIGTQEDFKPQLEQIIELPVYAYDRAGRDDGEDEGEHSAIRYNKNNCRV